MISPALGFSLHTQNQLPWLVVHLSAISDPRRTLAVGKAGGYTKGDANGCWLGKASLGHVLVEVNRMTSVRLPTASPTFHYRFWGKFPRSQSTKNRGWCPLSNLPPKGILDIISVLWIWIKTIQNHAALVNIKVAGTWIFIHQKSQSCLSLTPEEGYLLDFLRC